MKPENIYNFILQIIEEETKKIIIMLEGPTVKDIKYLTEIEK